MSIPTRALVTRSVTIVPLRDRLSGVRPGASERFGRALFDVLPPLVATARLPSQRMAASCRAVVLPFAQQA